jgi:hypothetical protein
MAETFSSFKNGVVSRVDEIYKNHSVRSTYHPIWHTAMAFFEGEQWKVWSKIEKELRDFNPASLTRKLVINRVEKIVTTFVAHFIRELPTFYVNPNSNTPEDDNSADLGQNILQVEYSAKLEEVLPDYFYWKYIIGTGIRGLFWDPKASAEIKLPQYDDNGIETGSKVLSVPDIGQLRLKAINPFNFFPVGGSTIDDCTEIVYVEPMPLELVKSQFDFDAVEENIETNIGSSSYHRDYREDSREKFEKRSRVFHYWKSNCAGFNDGVYAVVINGQRIDYRDNPYLQYGYKFPFAKSCAIPVPGQFWGKSPVEQIRRVQICYNYVYSLIIQTMERMGKLKWLIPTQCEMDPTTIDNNVGEFVRYTSSPGTAPPTQANLSPLPYYYFQVLEWLDKAFEDITGFHEVKSARLPTGANNPSGVMVNLLLEQDETRLSPAIKQYTSSLKSEARLYLKMVQDLYMEERVLKITGVEKEAEIQDFRGATLADNNDVQVEIAPVLSESRSAWEQTVFKALEMQVIDPRTAIRKLKLEHPKSLLNELADERLALRENVEMRQGKPRMPQEWEEDEVHLRIHEGFMKTATYEKLPEETKQVFMQHRMATQQQQAMKFQQRIAAQQQQMAGPQPQASPQQGGQPNTGQAPPGY